MNETDMGAAFSDVGFQSTPSAQGPLIFPHIGIKNTKVLVNFGVDQPQLSSDDPQWPIPKALLDKPAGAVKFFGQLDRSAPTCWCQANDRRPQRPIARSS